MTRFRSSILCRQAYRKKGQAIVEYALVLSVVSVLTITYMGGLGEQVRSLYMYVIDALAAAFSAFN
jgi:Flp pilus assembly pilin Flp